MYQIINVLLKVNYSFVNTNNKQCNKNMTEAIYSPVYIKPLIQIRIQIKVIQFLCKHLNPLLIRIRIYILMWIKSGLHVK